MKLPILVLVRAICDIERHRSVNFAYFPISNYQLDHYRMYTYLNYVY